MLLYLYVSLIFFTSFTSGQNNVPEDADEKRTMDIIMGDDVISEACQVKCHPAAKYRTVDGSCNNLNNPCWGKSYRGYSSFLPPQFGDDVGCPRKSKSGITALPIPRLISRQLHTDRDIRQHRISQLLVGLGQSIAVDFSEALDGVKNDTKYSCADVDNSVCKTQVEIPHGDNFLPSPSCTFILPNIHIRCNGTGSICGCKYCKPGQMEYVNAATSFIDASTIYGSTQRVMTTLRESNSSKLRTSQGDLLSRSDDKCANTQPNCDDSCFNTGAEVAGNGDILIASIYTLWTREHNRLVGKLRPYISDNETLYQEVKKIVGAMHQHVIYHEFLPPLLGNCGDPSLKVPTRRNMLRYDPNIDPTVASECYVGACRLGHTLLDGMAQMYHSNETFSVGEAKSVEPFCRGGSAVKDIVGGMVEQVAMKRDQYITGTITHELHFPGHPMTDLISIDITRGRQRGIPSYTDLLRFCNLTVPKTFEGMRKYFPECIVDQYRELYGEDGMENIDLNSAMLTEKTMEHCGGIWGPVTTCIVSEQFKRLKFGDRFWYEHLNEPQSFTKAQLHEIQKTTMARVICSNTDLQRIQKEALKLTSRENHVLSCRDVIERGDLDARKWKISNSQ